MGLLLFSTLLLPDVDKGKSREYEYRGKSYNPPDGTRPPYAVDVEKEVGEPVVARDEMSGVNESNVKVG